MLGLGHMDQAGLGLLAAGLLFSRTRQQSSTRLQEHKKAA
jgi:hypothetical protein